MCRLGFRGSGLGVQGFKGFRMQSWQQKQLGAVVCDVIVGVLGFRARFRV